MKNGFISEQLKLEELAFQVSKRKAEINKGINLENLFSTNLENKEANSFISFVPSWWRVSLSPEEKTQIMIKIFSHSDFLSC